MPVGSRGRGRLEVAGLLTDLGLITAVGADPVTRRTRGRDQHRTVGAGEPGQVAHVGEITDQEGIDGVVTTDDQVAQPITTTGVVMCGGHRFTLARRIPGQDLRHDSKCGQEHWMC